MSTLNNEKISVIGAGAWGTAISIHIARLGYKVNLWVREKETLDCITNTKMNKLFLPNHIIPENVMPSNDINEIIKDSKILLWAVPTQHLRKIISDTISNIPKNAFHINLAKGIEREHNIFPYDILKEYFGENSVSVMSGPSFADEVAAGKPTVLVIASKNNNFAKKIQHMFSNESLRIYTSDDPIGVSLGGALKNIIAIAAGICDGMELGHNARAALITRGLSEIVRLGNAMNVNIKTLFGIAGVGDLILTCTSKKSRNYIFGLRIGKGEKTEDIIASMNQVAEGIYSTYGALYLAKKFNVEMPITKTVHQIIWNGKSPKQGVIELMTRPLKSEW